MLFEFEDSTLEPIYEKVNAGTRLSYEDGVTLWKTHDLLGVGYMANMVREKLNGNKTYFIHNRHINPTNVCVLSCQFCAFGVKADHPHAYEKSLEDIFSDAEKYNGGEVSEFHIVGGLHPDYPFEYYLDLLKGFLRDAGLGSIPGGGAEVFAKRVRRKICGDKITGEEWLQVHEIAHLAGLKSNATLLYGHLETAEERSDHLVQLRELQDRTHGFVTFIPLAFHPENTVLDFLKTTPGQLDLRALAVSRLMLDNFPHIKAFWIMITPRIAQLAQSFGADDMDGTVVEEKIIHAAGAATDQVFHKDQIIHMITESGRKPVERDTLYENVNELEVESAY